MAGTVEDVVPAVVTEPVVTEPTVQTGKSEPKADLTTFVVDGKNHTFDVKIEGEERDKVIAAVQKGMAADKRFQAAVAKSSEADDTVRAAGNALQLQEALVKLQRDNTDMEAYETAAHLLGIPDDQVAEVKRVHTQQQTGAAPQGTVTQPPRSWTMEDMPKDVQDLVRTKKHEKVDDRISDAIASDPILKKAIGSDDNRAEAVKKIVTAQVRRQMEELGASAPHGTGSLAGGSKIIDEGVRIAREILVDLGTHDGNSQLPTLGAGRGPSESDSVGHPTEKPKRVPSNDPNYSKFLREMAIWRAMHPQET